MMDAATLRRIFDACNFELLLKPDPALRPARLCRMSVDATGEVGLELWHCAVLADPPDYACFGAKDDALTWARERGYKLVQRWPAAKPEETPDPPEGEVPIVLNATMRRHAETCSGCNLKRYLETPCPTPTPPTPPSPPARSGRSKPASPR